jgi:hypothetical protein
MNACPMSRIARPARARASMIAVSSSTSASVTV